MVAARRRVLESGLYDPVLTAVAERIDPESAVVVDAGSGTGHYLASCLDAAPDALGIGIDLSKYCARATARSHRRALAVVADLWEGIGVRTGAADALLSVFAPRNLGEAARILRPGGRWILVTPRPDHLAQLREPLGMLGIGDDKLARLHDDLTSAGFTVTSADPVTADLTLSAPTAADIAGMGPAGFHRTPDELAAAARSLDPSDRGIPATLDVTVTTAVTPAATGA
ncbi:MAG: methyltransferase [Gordonia sp. (in: high G+C Gram-positive bacteria)]|uniref:methyltransferase domain-containing protein n=1 Tax=Gordonia sp. (in: high G+C Gram-positive bacteria) TaxID=84139 RepID=UPI0039E434C5